MKSKKNQKPKEKEVESKEQRRDFYLEEEKPNPASEHDVPSIGIAQTDFVSRNYGRSTSRMIDHEPGLF